MTCAAPARGAIPTILFVFQAALFERLLGDDDTFRRVVGVFEYDPELPAPRPKHRRFLAEEVRFKQVVPIEDEECRQLIHMNFRLTFLRDVLIPRALDDATYVQSIA